MEDIRNGPFTYPWFVRLRKPLLVVLAVLAVAAMLRFAFIGADLPVFVSSAQDDVYNAPWYVADAQYIAQGRSPAYDGGSLKALWTGYFTLVFWLLGPGVWQGNAGTAVLGMVCVWLIYLLVRRAAGQGPAFIVLLLSATNFILVVYSRTPLPYIGVCAATTLCLYLWYILRSRSWWWLFVPYLLAVAFTLLLKSLCLFVLPVMAITDTLMLLRREGVGFLRRARPYFVVAGAAAVLVVIAFFAYPGFWAYVESRVKAHTEIGVAQWLRGMLSVGFETDYFTQMPLVAFLALLYPALLVMRWRERPEGELQLGLACTIFMIGSMAAFGFLKYRSLHYLIIMSPAMLILSALCVRELAATSRLGGTRRDLPALTVGFLLVTYLAYQAIAAVTVSLVQSGGPRGLVEGSVGLNVFTEALTLNAYGVGWALPLAAGVALTLVGSWRLVRTRLPQDGLKLPPGLAGRVAVAVVVASVVLNLAFCARFLTQRGYSMEHAIREIPLLLGDEAKITEHGCSFAGYGNRVRTERALFNFNSGMTRAGNPTHLFLNIHRANKRTRPPGPFEESEYVTPVAVLIIKHSHAILYRCRKGLPPEYRLSAYEQALELLRQGRPEPALQKLREEIERYPASGVLRSAVGVALLQMGRPGQAVCELRKALALVPEDFTANSYLAAGLTLTGRYGEALEKLEWMKNYYPFVPDLKRMVFDYRESLLTAGGAGDAGATRKLLESVFLLLSGYPPGLRVSAEDNRDVALPQPSPELLKALRERPEAREAAGARARFEAALDARDFERAAGAVNLLARLSGRRKPLVQSIRELYPIGATSAYPLDSLDISGEFVRRRMFYWRVASAIAAGKASEEDRILGAFDWVVRNAWPLHASSTLSGRTPYEVALSGSAVVGETGWLLCTILENLGIPAVFFDIQFENEPRLLPLVAAGSGRWYLFAPDAGLALAVKDTSRVATVDDLLEGRAALPGEEPLQVAPSGGIIMILPAEAQAYLHGAAVLEDMLKRDHLRCHRKAGDLEVFASLASAAAGTENARFHIWRYPFLVETGLETSIRSLIETNERKSDEDTYLKARTLQLTGRYAEALALLGGQPAREFALILAEARLGAGDSEGALKVLEGTSFKGSRADRTAYVAGSALAALGRNSDAAQAFRRITGPRAALGAFLAEKALGK